MVWLLRVLQTLLQSSSTVQGYALLLLGTSVTVAGAMYLTAEFVLEQVSLNSLRVIPLVADVGALATAPYTADSAQLRFRGLRSDAAEEALRDSTARASATSSGGFGGGDALAALLDPNRAPTPVVQTITSTATAIAATVTPPPRGPEGNGPGVDPVEAGNGAGAMDTTLNTGNAFNIIGDDEVNDPEGDDTVANSNTRGTATFMTAEASIAKDEVRYYCAVIHFPSDTNLEDVGGDSPDSDADTTNITGDNMAQGGDNIYHFVVTLAQKAGR